MFDIQTDHSIQARNEKNVVVNSETKPYQIFIPEKKNRENGRNRKVSKMPGHFPRAEKLGWPDYGNTETFDVTEEIASDLKRHYYYHFNDHHQVWACKGNNKHNNNNAALRGSHGFWS